jgi:hypothetical protein
MFRAQQQQQQQRVPTMRRAVAKQPERAAVAANWKRGLPTVEVSDEDADSCNSSTSCARDVQKKFVEVQNAEHLHQLLHGNNMYAQNQSIQVRCASIIGSALCAADCCDRPCEAAEKEFFMAFTKATAGFLHADATKKSEMLDAVARSCEQLAELLEDKVCTMRADQALIPVDEPLTADRLRNEELLQVYTLLLAEIDRMREMRRQHALAKADYEQVCASLLLHKLDFFERNLKCMPVARAPLDPADPQCNVCGEDFTSDGAVARLTLACCQHKQSICNKCFVASTYAKSNKGIKSFTSCPFCRAEYALYEPKRRRIDASRRLDFDTASSPAPSPAKPGE